MTVGIIGAMEEEVRGLPRQKKKYARVCAF